MKQKSTVALWQWSQTLQRKVRPSTVYLSAGLTGAVVVQALMSWLLYTINRKRKAERYAEALQRHRSRLLHIGVTQWIKVGLTCMHMYLPTWYVVLYTIGTATYLYMYAHTCTPAGIYVQCSSIHLCYNNWSSHNIIQYHIHMHVQSVEGRLSYTSLSSLPPACSPNGWKVHCDTRHRYMYTL